MTQSEIDKKIENAQRYYRRQRLKKARGQPYLREPEYWLEKLKLLRSLKPDT